ncbi:hypothetical protein JNB11_05240 [Kocuria palustris]|nr:hypothetical protein [Kocuria palustris]
MLPKPSLPPERNASRRSNGLASTCPKLYVLAYRGVMNVTFPTFRWLESSGDLRRGSI